MDKNKVIARITIALLILTVMAFWTPQVSATTNYRMILPFWTGWEEGAGIPIGRTNVVDWKTTDFYGYYGPGDPLPPELGVRDSGDGGVTTPPDGAFYGYDFGDRYLMAAGHFGSSYSYCYFSLFDMTADSDYQPPIKLRPQTFINIFYYHHQLGDCMVDAQLYNKATKQYWTLRDFNYEGKYITDQNGVRIHPAYRSNDPIGSWQFATFDLSIVYWSFPENWYITKIWIGFDNGNDHSTGQARTYFDLLHISYGISGYWPWAGPWGTTDTVSGSIIAWEYNPAISGNELKLKVTISGATNQYVLGYTPYTLKVSVDHAATALTSPKPTGVNIWDFDSEWPEVDEFVMDCAWSILQALPGWLGGLFTVSELASEFYGLLTTPPGGATFQWPDAITGPAASAHPDFILGEVYILVSGLSSGSNTIPIEFIVDYYNWVPVFFSGYWGYLWSPNLVLNFPFSTTPDDVNLPPETPSKPSGPTSGYAGISYTYSTSTTDSNGHNVRYQFDWGDGSTTTTGWYASGATASAPHSWSSTGTYYVKARAQDTYEAWSGWSSSLTVYIYNRAPNTPSKPSGPTSGYRSVSYTYSTSTTDPDGDNLRYQFDWGDGSTTTTGWYASGATASAPHSWSSTGTYYVKARAQDTYEAWSGWSSSLTVYISSNRAPNTPSKPSGPTSGYRNVWYTYSTSTTDPDGDDVRYEFEFSGPIPTVSFTTGWYASGETGSITVMWETTDPPGTYYIRTRAQDVYGDWSGWSSSLTVYIYNRAPNTPSKPSGPTSGYRSVSYTYSTSTTDPDGDNFRYQFDWGDGSTTTTGWYASGATASAPHSWSSTGTYYVKARAQDTYGAWSGWSASLTVYISSGGGGCPILYVYDGSEYIHEGLLDIHDPDGTDVITDHTLVTTPETICGTYRLRLVEHPQTVSHIDQVKLYAILPDETLTELPLVWARHSEYGNVLPQLLSSDDWKTETLGADHNNGVSESIELRFAALSPKVNIIGLVFQIEGNNMFYKVAY